MGSMNVYGLQFDIAWEDKAANFATVRRLLVDSCPEPGALVVLPEMFATGFSMNAGSIAEDENGETVRFLAEMAERWRCHILGGVVTRSAAGEFFNRSLLLGPTSTVAAHYTKMYPFTPGGERDHYTAGEHPVVVPLCPAEDTAKNTTGGKPDFHLAPFICYDLRFPEAFRDAARRGATLYAVIASWPEARIGHWVALLQARAIENQAYVIGVNRCGTDPFFRYTGHSRIFGPDGATLAEAGEGEAVLCAEIDPEVLVAYRGRLPFLQDMRPASVPPV
ncbi:MAG: carbon-nitrogen family hydrolase [Armatimonadaceae bacterium]